MPRTDTAQRLVLIEESLEQIKAMLSALVSPSDERKHIADNAATAEQIDGLADDAADMQDATFQARQIVSILQGTRADIVQMRATLLRLCGLLEQVLRARVDDDERRRRAGDEERRKAG